MSELVTVQWCRKNKTAQVFHQWHKPFNLLLECKQFPLTEFVLFVFSVYYNQPQKCPHSSHLTSEIFLFSLGINLSPDQTILWKVLPWSNGSSDGLCVVGTLIYGQQICVTGCCARRCTCAVKNLLAESLNPWAEWTITWRNPYSPGVSSSGAQTWGVSREAVVMWTLKNRPLSFSSISCFCKKKFPHWALSSVRINSPLVVKSIHCEKNSSTISILSVFWYTWKREWWCFMWWRALNDECFMRVDWNSSSILSLTCHVRKYNH